MKINTSPVNNPLSWHGAVCPCSFFCVSYNEILKTQSVTKQELPKFQTLQYPAYQNDSLKKEMDKKVLAKAEYLIDKILSCPRNKLSSSHTSILDDVETRIFLLDFAQQLRRINADFPGIYII